MFEIAAYRIIHMMLNCIEQGALLGEMNAPAWPQSLLIESDNLRKCVILSPMWITSQVEQFPKFSEDRGIHSCLHCLLHLNHSGHFVPYKQPLQFLGVIFFFNHNVIIIRWSWLKCIIMILHGLSYMSSKIFIYAVIYSIILISRTSISPQYIHALNI